MVSPASSKKKFLIACKYSTSLNGEQTYNISSDLTIQVKSNTTITEAKILKTLHYKNSVLNTNLMKSTVNSLLNSQTAFTYVQIKQNNGAIFFPVSLNSPTNFNKSAHGIQLSYGLGNFQK